MPFFPDFVVIDSFKREICVSLEEYNGKIESLRKEMEDYTLTTEAVQVVWKPLCCVYVFFGEGFKLNPLPKKC